MTVREIVSVSVSTSLKAVRSAAGLPVEYSAPGTDTTASVQ